MTVWFFSRYSPTGNGKFTDGTKLLKLTDTNKYKAIKLFDISKFGHENLDWTDIHKKLDTKNRQIRNDRIITWNGIPINNKKDKKE